VAVAVSSRAFGRSAVAATKHFDCCILMKSNAFIGAGELAGLHNLQRRSAPGEALLLGQPA
jgi:hypothetical protein